MARRIARPIHLVVAWLLVAGLLVQVFLAGMGVFDSSSSSTRTETSATR